MATTIIVIGYNPARNREEGKSFPSPITVKGQCPTCTCSIVYEFDRMSGSMLEYPSAGLPKRASEYYQLEVDTPDEANTWITKSADTLWLNDPCKVIMVYDPTLAGSAAGAAKPAAALPEQRSAVAKRSTR